MKLTQKLDLRKLLVPELKQSLEILSLPLIDLKTMVEEELEDNPFLEEKTDNTPPSGMPRITVSSQKLGGTNSSGQDDFDPFAQLSQTPSLQDVLLRQLETSTLNDEELRIGHEIIGNIDDAGYLRIPIEEIAALSKASLETTEKVLKVIHKFEPAGVAARSIQECLLIQCATMGLDDALLKEVIAKHLDDVAKRKYEVIAKALNAPLEAIETCVKKLTTLDPKPGQNYATESICEVVPDIFIDEKDGELEITISRENIPSLSINEEYRDILKNNNLTPEAKEYLNAKLQDALELLRAIARRQSTLRNVLEVIVNIQKTALINGFAELKPMTFQDVADKIDMHASTVCRVVMNKYAQTPQGVIALKSLFTSGIAQENGEHVSSSHCKIRIQELVEGEDKKKPLSDEDISGILLKENGVKLARRTVAKYREELKILPSSLRRDR